MSKSIVGFTCTRMKVGATYWPTITVGDDGTVQVRPPVEFKEDTGLSESVQIDRDLQKQTRSQNTNHYRSRFHRSDDFANNKNITNFEEIPYFTHSKNIGDLNAVQQNRMMTGC